jgi:hypothetical protein
MIAALLSVYAMITWDFEVKIFLIQLAAIAISLNIFIDDFKDIQVSRQ